MERVIILLDVDCFEHQVWTSGDPDAQLKPGIIVNSSKKIVAVNYAAREFGISRNDNLAAAQGKCSDLEIVVIPDRWGKPDQKTPRLASYELYASLLRYRTENNADLTIDYSSRDEFFIDVTNFVRQRMVSPDVPKLPRDFHWKTILEMEEQLPGAKFVENFWLPYNIDEKQLFLGAIIAGEMLKQIKLDTNFETSAGVSVNKLLAKIACKIHKPQAVTVLTKAGLPRVAKSFKIQDIPTLGGKLGIEITNYYGINSIDDLRSIPEQDLQEKFGEEVANEIIRLAAGLDNSVVVEKSTKETIICGKSLFGNRILRNINALKNMLQDFAEEMSERLEEERLLNNRRPLEIKIQLTRQMIEGDTVNIPSIPADSGVIQISRDVVDAREIMIKAMSFFKAHWSENKMRPLKYVTKAQLIARKFIAITEDSRFGYISEDRTEDNKSKYILSSILPEPRMAEGQQNPLFPLSVSRQRFTSVVSDMDDSRLYEYLVDAERSPGPVTNTTRSLYRSIAVDVMLKEENELSGDSDEFAANDSKNVGSAYSLKNGNAPSSERENGNAFSSGRENGNAFSSGRENGNAFSSGRENGSVGSGYGHSTTRFDAQKLNLYEQPVRRSATEELDEIFETASESSRASSRGSTVVIPPGPDGTSKVPCRYSKKSENVYRQPFGSFERETSTVDKRYGAESKNLRKRATTAELEPSSVTATKRQAMGPSGEPNFQSSNAINAQSQEPGSFFDSIVLNALAGFVITVTVLGVIMFCLLWYLNSGAEAEEQKKELEDILAALP